MPLTGKLGPLGPRVVDATQREAPQPLIEQLPVPDPEAQEDAVDLVLCRWLQGRERRMGRGRKHRGSPASTLPPSHPAACDHRAEPEPPPREKKSK